MNFSKTFEQEPIDLLI